jgi:hypothetical protein
MTGWGTEWRASTAQPTERMKTSACSWRAWGGALTSAPELKSSPSPVTTTQRTSGVTDSERNVASMSGQGGRRDGVLLARIGERHRGHGAVLLDLHEPHPGHDTDGVGLNPFRQHRRPADVLAGGGGAGRVRRAEAWALFG